MLLNKLLNNEGEFEFRPRSQNVMMREGPTPTAAMAFADVVGTQAFLRYDYRQSTGGSIGAANGVSVLARYWLKLVRAVNVFTAYGSPTKG